MFLRTRRRRAPRLLYLAFYFPPTRASGVFRAVATANHFADAGWEVTVFAAPREFFTDYIDSVDPSLDATVHPAVRVERPGMNYYHWEQDIRRYSILRGNFPTLAARMHTRARQRFLPEPYLSWFPRVVGRAAALAARRRFDVVLATGNPFVSFVAARAIGRFLRVPYVVDYRDAWTYNQFTGEPKFDEKDPSWTWERRVLRNAAEVVFVNDGMRQWAAERYPFAAGRMTVVPNGYEPEILGDLPFHSASTARPLRFGYIGTMSHVLPVEEMFEGWRLARKQPELSDATFAIYGHLGFFPRHVAQMRALLPLDEGLGVSYEGPVPKADIGRVYGDLDVLVLCTAGRRYVTTGKVFEYMAAGRPIVSVHEPDVAAAEVLAGYPLWSNPGSLRPSDLQSAFVRAAQTARTMTAEDARAARAYAERFTRANALDPFQQRLRRLARA